MTVFAVSLGLTLLLELPVAYYWGLRSRHDLTVAVLVNVLTNPAVVLLNGLLSAAPWWCSCRWRRRLSPWRASATGIAAKTSAVRTCSPSVPIAFPTAPDWC